MTVIPHGDALTWFKSSFSDQEGTECVEVADHPDGGRFVRDSKHPAGGMLSFTAGEWSAFVQGVRAGEFD